MDQLAFATANLCLCAAVVIGLDEVFLLGNFENAAIWLIRLRSVSFLLGFDVKKYKILTSHLIQFLTEITYNSQNFSYLGYYFQLYSGFEMSFLFWEEEISVHFRSQMESRCRTIITEICIFRSFILPAFGYLLYASYFF